MILGMVVSNFHKKRTLAYFSKNDPLGKVSDQLDTRLIKQLWPN